MPDPRLYHEAELGASAKLRLDPGQAHKLAHVLRLGLGASVRLFNGRDGEWRAEIDAKDRAGIGVIVRERLRPARLSPDIDLLFAPLKRDATDWLVEKASELGVRRLRPVTTARTIAETVRIARLAAIARHAAEQCERFDAPAIASPVALARALADWEGERRLVYADESGEVWGGDRAPALPAALAREPKPARAALLIGPEGGFSVEERRWLRSLSFVLPVSLGPRILRAETAAVAALALIQAAWGDW